MRRSRPGPRGLHGPTGPTGPTGPAGSQGAVGPSGIGFAAATVAAGETIRDAIITIPYGVVAGRNADFNVRFRCRDIEAKTWKWIRARVLISVFAGGTGPRVDFQEIGTAETSKTPYVWNGTTTFSDKSAVLVSGLYYAQITCLGPRNAAGACEWRAKWAFESEEDGLV